MQERKNIKLIELIDQKTGQTQPYILQMDLVGKGYYGAVYKAVHQYKPQRIYAVKVITLKRQQTKEQILKQLQIIQKIPKSPNLVDTHKQHLQSKKHLYIFQEFCEGGSLAQFKQKMQGKLMREQVAFDLFYQLGRGYIDLYNAGIIHEDIKPSNILLKGKLYKYCDFGVSQLACNLKYEQSRKGTVSYMPPQKLQSKFKPGAKSDIFSLGVTLYEVIFGLHPYLKKKTKNTKQYLMTLRNAQLAPSHQLMRRIYNPTLKMNKLINLIQGMICRKPQLRMSIQQLQDVLFNQQPFRSMTIPLSDDQLNNIENLTTLNNNNNHSHKKYQQKNNTRNNYNNIQISPYINQSKVFVIPKTNNNQNNTNNLQQEEQNRLFSYNIELQQSDQFKNKLQDQLKQGKINQEEENKLLQEVFREYHCIQDVITYLNTGIKTLQYVYNQLQFNKTCDTTYFTQYPFSQLSLLKQQSPCEVIHFLVLKLNVQLMSSFSKSVQNNQRFYQQVPIWQQVQYLQAQVSKYVADSKNIKEKQVKKGIISLCKEMNLREYCDVLIREFDRMFDNVVVGNSVRVNFKDDLLNGIFLVHVNKILNQTLSLPSIVQPQKRSQLVLKKLYYDSMRLIQQTTRRFNEYRTFKRERLKQCFYKQFQGLENIIFDIQQNDDEFVNLLDDEFIASDQEQEKQNKQVRIHGNLDREISQLFENINIDVIQNKEQLTKNRQQIHTENNLIIDV